MTHAAELAVAADFADISTCFDLSIAPLESEPSQPLGPLGHEEKDALFRQLVSEYGHALHYFVLRRVGNETDAAEIAQQAFVEAAVSLTTFRGEARVSTWLFGIATNLARNFVNRSPRRRYDNKTTDVLDEYESPAADPCELLAN